MRLFRIFRIPRLESWERLAKRCGRMTIADETEALAATLR
jgi:hypothetical protein